MIPRGDRLSKKGKKVNKELQEKCTAENFAFILHKSINSKLDLFPDKLHPNEKGQSILKNLIKKPTCFRNPENPKTIDLILTNRPRSFCNSDTLETGLSDFHKLTVTVLKMFFKKQSPNVISYRNYKNFLNDSFRTNLINEISSSGILEADLTGFLDACKKSLDYQAPRKKKYTRANQASFLAKEINKEIMTRSRLRNKFLCCRSDENKKAYNEQRNRCVKLVRSAKKAYYSNLSIKDVNAIKNFGKWLNPFSLKK